MGVENVPLIQSSALRSYFSKKGDDYQRSPMLLLGCLACLGARIENAMEYDLSSVVDLGKIGEKLSTLPDYWETIDIIEGSKKLFHFFGKLVTGVSEDGAKEKFNPLDALTECALYSLKVASNAVNLIGQLVDTKALIGVAFTPLKLYGSVAGGIYWANEVYKDAMKTPEEPAGVDNLVEEAKDIYRAQNAKMAVCASVLKVSVLAIKVIGAAAAYYLLYGGPAPVKYIAQKSSDLLLICFTGLMASDLTSHFLSVQMKEFSKKNQALA